MNRFLTIFCFSVLLFSCRHDHDPLPQRDHTLLVYMIAENNLAGNAADDYQEIIQGMKNAPSDFVTYVYMDDYATPRLYAVTSKGAKLIQSYNEVNSASSQQLRKVLDKVKASSPSDSFGLILWSHGLDWVPAPAGSKSASGLQIKPRFFGQDGSKWMDISDIQAAIKDHELLYLAFDACYMSSVEVTYRLKDKADYFMASVMEILSDGYPYQLVLPALYSASVNDQPEAVLASAAKAYFDYYDQHSDITKRAATISLIRTQALEQLAGTCQPILSAHGHNLSSSILQGVQYFERQHYPSWIYDLHAYLSSLASPSELAQVDDAVSACIVYKAHTATLPYSNTLINDFSGFGCYIPCSGMTYNTEYEAEPWYQRTYLGAN